MSITARRARNISKLFCSAFLLSGAIASANTVMVFNPWDGQIPVQNPVAFVNGVATGIPATSSSALCGWYAVPSPSMPTSIRFQASGNGSLWGSGGPGSAAAIDLSTYGMLDTVWIAPVAALPKVTKVNPGNIGTCQSDPNGTHVILSSGRCDLLSSPLTGTTGCMDLAKLDGTTLDVPDAVTRLSREGFVLCGAGKIVVPGSDIAYIVDQSGSMTAFHSDDLILPHGADTLNFGSCKTWTSPAGATIPSSLPMVQYKGNSVQLLPADAYDSAMAHCSPSGDPYQVRAAVVKAAINRQAQLAPTSRAAFISFGSNYSSTALYDLGDTLARSTLLKQVLDTNLDKTNYADPIGWARSLLQGATSSGTTMPASPNKRRAIILVSDGSPNDEDSAIAKLAPGAVVKAPDGTTWTLPDVASPPIYGFMLSTSSSSGKALKKLADLTGGQYFQIPPLDRDSLNRVMERLLGLLANNTTPDSLRITNLTNGQVSNAVSVGTEGAGFRFPLDSIIGLDTGKNVLELRNVMHDPSGDSVRTVRWTLNVQSSSSHFVPADADTTLMARCYEPTSLKLRPTIDTSRLYADQRDAKVSTFLDTKLAGPTSFLVQFSTAISKDQGLNTLTIKSSATATRALVSTTNPWGLAITTPNISDATIQTSYGWDTLQAIFHMPRDYRDSAIGFLPMFRYAPVGIILSPDTVSGDSGRFSVVVSDPNLTADTTSARILHRLGDSLRVPLTRSAPGIYIGTFAFQQNRTVVQGDGILQLGPSRTLKLDSVRAEYLDSRDTALVRRIDPRLLFVDAFGTPLDSMALRTIDLGTLDTIRFGLFINGQILVQSDSVSVSSSSWLATGVAGLRLSAGLGTIVVRGLRPGVGGAVVIRLAGTLDSLVRPLDVDGLTLRFLAADGTVADTFGADTVVRSSVDVRLQLWSRTQPILRDGTVRVASDVLGLNFADVSGRIDSLFPLVDGMVTIRVRSDRPVSGGVVRFIPDSSWGSATATPLTWHAIGPDSAVYRDTDGDGAVDNVRVHFSSPWNPANRFVFPWPDGNSALDHTQAVPYPSSDSMMVEWIFSTPQYPLLTAWNGAPVPALFAWNASDAIHSFPVREEIAPVPLRARLSLGEGVDTLRVWMSEPIRTEEGAEWIRWGRPSLDPAGLPIERIAQDTATSWLVELLVDASFQATSDDSIRLAPGPLGGVSDSTGNSPGAIARWVPLEIVPGPFKISVAAWPPMAIYTGWTIPTTEAPLTVFVRADPNSPWLGPDGSPATVDPSHYSGALIKTTRNLKEGALYVYDNEGISVASLNLQPILESVERGVIDIPMRGDLQIWIAWNGTSQNGRPVSSGVYLARMFGWAEVDNQKVIYNQVYKLGWRIP